MLPTELFPDFPQDEFADSETIPLLIVDSDPQVRRALHLALDRHALVDVVKDMMPAMVG